MKIAVIGVAQTKFGELWDRSLTDLLAESQLAAIEDAGLGVSDIDTIFTGNMCAPYFSNQSNLASVASSILNLSIPSFTVEAACASGGLAIRAATAAIESGQANIVLVNGVEKMTDVPIEKVSEGLSAAASAEWEQIHGATFPALDALIAKLYMNKYGLTREQLAMVSVQSHHNGSLNPLAHFQKKITVDHVINSPMIADPLTLLDCSPVSDGAASVILCNEETAKRLNSNPVFITGSGHATDTLSLSERDDLLSWSATCEAVNKAYEMAGVSASDVDLVELHDAFSIVHIISLEDLGFFERGQAGAAIGELSVNPSGGLKARGHPVGATGIAQVVEVVKQLRGECGERQVKDAKIGLTHNAGGCGANVVVHVFKRGEP